LTAYDKLGNSTLITDTFYFDGVAPVAALTVTPLAEEGIDGLHGNVYTDRIILKGSFLDAHSGIAAARITVTDTLVNGEPVIQSPLTLDAGDSPFSRSIELIEGENIITLEVRDWAGNLTTTQAILRYIPPKVSTTIGDKGGSVLCPNGTRIVIPENGLFSPVTITIVRTDLATLPKPEESTIQLIGAAYDFSPDGLVFRKEAELTLAYTEADLDLDMDGTADVSEEDLTIYFLDKTSWRPVGEAVVDTVLHRIAVSTNHFTLYAVGTRAALPNKIKSYWTHNPLVRSEQATFQFEMPEKGTVSLSIYDMAGDLIRILLPEKTKKDAGVHSIRWNGANGRDRFAGTGLYLYVFKVETVNEKKIVKKPIAIVNR